MEAGVYFNKKFIYSYITSLSITLRCLWEKKTQFRTVILSAKYSKHEEAGSRGIRRNFQSFLSTASQLFSLVYAGNRSLLIEDIYFGEITFKFWTWWRANFTLVYVMLRLLTAHSFRWQVLPHSVEKLEKISLK